MESTSWANAETPLQFIFRHQPGGLAALALDGSECVVVMDTLWFRYPLLAQWETRVMAALVECSHGRVCGWFVVVFEMNCPLTDERICGPRTQ
ncbi:hypothetical protein TNCT_361961 [Trichonephila clavata]|uniref:Uncharacterized protein n=1 Tax=Trichonephila clavata TaxID=2740835 RepID=A0A8X6KVL2_TRICU|nr:hypothetical protein TNCT_361961 [Trichonephila clavata]